MCQICERVTLARLSCPERSRPKDGVSPIVVVVPVAELAACSDGKLSHGWCWCASGERNNIVQLQLDHVSCTELLSLSMQRLRYDILNWWWRPLGHQAVIDWRTEEWGTQLLIWPGVAYWPIAGCCRLPGLRSQARDEVAWKRRLKLHRRKVLRFWMRPDISSTFQTRCSWIYMDLWYYWIIMMQRNCV